MNLMRNIINGVYNAKLIFRLNNYYRSLTALHKEDIPLLVIFLFSYPQLKKIINKKYIETYYSHIFIPISVKFKMRS